MSIEENNFYKSGEEKVDRDVYQGAIEDYSRAIELNPKNEDPYINRGHAKFNLEDYQGAIEDYSKVIELDNGNMYQKVMLKNRSAAYKKLSELDQENIQN